MEGEGWPWVLCGTRTPPMRTFIFSVLLGAQVLTFRVYANNPTDAPIEHTALERELLRQIDKYVTYPLLDKRNMDGEVLISLVIDAEGQAAVIEAHATSAELLAYVLRRLEKVDVGANPDGTWRTTHLHLSFRPEV